MAKQRYTIAIVDEEARERNFFLNFFENDFNVIEISHIKSFDELIEVIKANHVDSIAIDYRLKDRRSRFTQNGDYFFKELHSRLIDFPAFIFTNDSSKAKKESKLIKHKYIIDKAILHSDDEQEVQMFKKELTQEIKTFKHIFDIKIKRLKKLQLMRRAKVLNQELENEYLKINNEVSQIISGYETLPQKYFSQDTNNKLDEIILKTDALIKKISKKK